MKQIGKYAPLAKEYAKSHAVGGTSYARSVASFIEGFNQAVQFLEPDYNLVVCPKCNTANVACHEISYPKSNLPILQYPLSMDAVFVCHQCEHTFNRRLKLSAQL
jgi:hypothetical protein